MADEINQSGYPQTPTSMSGLIQPPTDREKINSAYEPGSQVDQPGAIVSQANQDMNPAAPNSSFTPLIQQSGRVGASTALYSEPKPGTKKVQVDPVGSSGTQLYGGYFTEEYLQTLRGRLGAIKWDEMRRSEPQITMLIGAVLNSIKSATWEFESFKPGDANYDKHRDLIQHIFNNEIHFSTYKQETLTHVFNGFALFEKIHSVHIDDPTFGTHNGLKALAWRSPKTVYRWNLEKKTGKLLGVEQYVFSDIGDNVYIPGEFLMCISHNKEGDNYEGISILRSMFGPWMRKNLYHKLMAIGIEKYAVGTPVATVPAGKETGEDMDNLKKLLQAFTSHEMAFLTIPEGWKIEILRGEFDPSKIKEVIVLENTEMINSIGANFLALGMSGSGGAYALSGDLSDFFLKGIVCIGDNVCDSTNRGVIEDLVKMNYGPQAGYPKLKISGINDKAGKELADALDKLISNSKAIKPDAPLEDHLRKLYQLPKKDESTQGDYAVVRVTEALAPETVAEASKEFHEHARTLKLAEKSYRKKFDGSKEEIKQAMRDNLLAIYDGFKDDIRAAYKSATPANKTASVLKLKAMGQSGYKSALQDILGTKAKAALANARAQVPKAKNVQLAESDDYDALPPAIRKIIDAQAQILSDTQVQDLEKAVYFQFASSAGTEEDIDRIINDIDEKILPTLEDTEGQTMGINLDAAAGDVLAQVERQTEHGFFFDDEVLGEIESFTLVNEDPVSEICTELEGTTLAADDPDLDTYWTPLHHNCKSRWRPNLVGDDSNPEVDRNGLNLSRKALDSITLAELTTKGRKHVAASNFVFPAEKRYPIHDLAHARNALARSSGKPEEAKVRAAVYRKYPALKKK